MDVDWLVVDAGWRHIADWQAYRLRLQMQCKVRLVMRSVILNEYGANDVLRYTEVDRPEPRAGEMLVKIHAAGVNPVDWKIRSGLGRRLGLALPIHLGGEIAGTVAALGTGVDAWAVGDEVFGIIDTGGFAEYVAVDAGKLARKPANLDFIHAAGVPLGALTSWQAMFGLGGLAAGQRLLITNASGGVGSLAAQLAKAKGAHVTAMASGRNERFVRDLGVDDFIDYTRQPFEQVARNMDVVFDTVGGDTYQRAFATLKHGGSLVTAVEFPKEEGQEFGVRTARVFCKADASQLNQIRAFVEDGRLRPQVTETLPLAEVHRALELSESGRTRGKIVLQIGA